MMPLTKSQVSLMPQGLLNRLSREEILDLVQSFPYLGEKAKNWAKTSIKSESNFYNNDTMAAICFKLKEKEDALKYARKAIELAKAEGSDYAETEALIKKIEALEYHAEAGA